MRHPDEYDPRTTSVLTASVATAAPIAPAAPQQKRRMLFVSLLALVLLPSLVAALLPDAQAEETILAAAEADEVAPVTAPPTTATSTSTTVAPSSTAAPTTTAAPKPSTTSTTAKPAPTTTAAPRPVARVAPAPAPAAPAPVAAAGGPTAAESAFLACVRQRESGGNYGVVSANGLWYGAYQMTRQTWDSTAQRAGRPDLVGVPPNQASPGDQDHLALVLYRWLGKQPWGGAC